MLTRPAAPDSSRAGRRAAPLCALVLLALAALGWSRRWITDDAFINFRVVENLHSGLGPVYNPGERVEAYTSALWLGMLWAVSGVLPFADVEWIAVVLGMALSLFGFAAAARGAWWLWRASDGPRALVLPLGLVVAVALPPLWDFVTSGLETSLAFAWLGGSWWVATARFDRTGGRMPPAALLFGLGPLIRPDLAVFSLGFAIAWAIATGLRGRMPWLRLLGLLVLPALAYQVFRMGYFAALVPNTALAKEAGLAYWSHGWLYLLDFVRPYLLALPVAALAALALTELHGKGRGGRRVLLVAACPAACALVHAVYVVRVGGDFMHGRMLLPSLFGALLPVAVVPVRRPGALAIAAGVVVWAVVCAAFLRAPYAGTREPSRPSLIVDERAFYVSFAERPDPVTLADHRRSGFAQYGAALRGYARRGERLLSLAAAVPDPRGRVPGAGELARTAPAVVVAASYPSVGLAGYAAGPAVYIVDQVGLGDPLAGRHRLVERGRAGHEKLLPIEWAAARFGGARPAPPPGVRLSPGGVEAARAALRCPPLARLLRAVSDPMTPRRFVSNLGASFELTRLRFAADPAAAADELCAPGGVG